MAQLRFGTKQRLVTAAIFAASTCAVACGHRAKGPKLERADDGDVAIPVVPEPPENGPKIGAIANETPIYDRPSKHGKQLGYLHAGATVVRSVEPFSTAGCEAGWFPIRPFGFVCGEGSATTNLSHPTLLAMAIQPTRDGTLPYTYARATRDTTLFEPDPSRDEAVRPLGTLRAKSGLAVVGSWTAKDPSGQPLRLAMMTDGHFVPAGDLEAASPSEFRGTELDHTKLPIAFVVKRGVHAWQLHDGEPEKHEVLTYHTRLDLTGHKRTISGVEFWATKDARWVRLRDVTLIRERSALPDFASGDQRWLDLSVVTGALVAYEGDRAVYATLASVGRDRLGRADGVETSAATARGEFEITGKQVTAVARDPNAFDSGIEMYDVPWALELSSGQLVVGAYWHDRFGIEHGPGNVELAPFDAAYLFRWAEPALPEGWHAITGKPRSGKPTLVSIRK